jgi:hypothetical protein
MSYTSPELIPSQKRWAVSSTASQLGANQIAAVSAISDGGSYGSPSADRPSGLMRGQSEVPATAIIVSQREPTRSFFHSSFRGHLGMKDPRRSREHPKLMLPQQHPLILLSMHVMFVKTQQSWLPMYFQIMHLRYTADPRDPVL